MAKYEKYDESDGVWRTVGGRRIFIRDGQSLSDAMKASGKFKSTKKSNKPKPWSKEDYEERDRRLQKRVDEGLITKEDAEYEKLKQAWTRDEISREEFDKKREELYSKKEKTPGEIASEEELKRTKEYEKQDQERDQKAKETGVRGKPDSFGNYSKTSSENDKSSLIKSQQSDIEKASGLKVQKAFATDAYGTGKEDRFELEDGRWISHSTESMGQKEDVWSVNKLENGKIESEDFKSYNDMIKHLSREEQGYGSSYKKYFDKNPNATFEDFEKDYSKHLGGSNKQETTTKNNFEDSINEVKRVQATNYLKSQMPNLSDKQAKDYVNKLETTTKNNKYAEYYKKEHLGEPSNYQKGDKIEFNNGYYETIKGSIVREATDSEKKYHINSNLKGYIVRDENGNEHIVADTKIKGRGETNKAYKNAYEEYKKKHPNTKLSYGQFVDVSEGK